MTKHTTIVHCPLKQFPRRQKTICLYLTEQQLILEIGGGKGSLSTNAIDGDYESREFNFCMNMIIENTS